ncbi:MAG: hypothetical protein LKF11_04885 [Pseudoramibacter sp.]|jgi:hypothetical protein|nr:hypothetical protein [Pseudoramibacter sp.]MCH4106048.1 hypothetical protein [Pseudoramibacter sp.]
MQLYHETIHGGQKIVGVGDENYKIENCIWITKRGIYKSKKITAPDLGD